jgi:hypothetical protein
VTGYGLDGRMIGVRFPAGVGSFSLRHRVQTGSGAHSVSYPMGKGVSSGVKRPGREANHSHPSSVEVKECVELYLHSPVCFHGVVISQAQGLLYLYLLYISMFQLQNSVSLPSC